MSALKRTHAAVEAWDDSLDEYLPGQISGSAETYRRFLRLMNPRVGETLLDIGGGTGDLMNVAFGLGLRCHGLEDTPEAAVISQKGAPQAQVVIASDLELPFADNHFDMVTTLSLVAYFPDPEQGLVEIHRVMKYGGRACLVLPNAEFQGKTAGGTLAAVEPGQARTLSEWKETLEGAGLTVVLLRPAQTVFTETPAPGGEHFWARWWGRLQRWLARFRPLRWTSHFVCFCCKA